MRVALALAFALAWIAPSASVRAQALNGALRLDFATPLFEYTHGKLINDFSIRDYTRVTIGPRSSFGLGVGYGFRERLLVGADLWVAHEVERAQVEGGPGSGLGQGYGLFQRLPSVDATRTRWSAQLAPYLELLFGRGRLRPFAGVTALFVLHRDRWDSRFLLPRVWHQTGLQLGVGLTGGAHWFLSDAVSLDGSLRLSGARSFVFGDVEQHTTSVSIAAIFGFSGWIR